METQLSKLSTVIDAQEPVDGTSVAEGHAAAAMPTDPDTPKEVEMKEADDSLDGNGGAADEEDWFR